MSIPRIVITDENIRKVAESFKGSFFSHSILRKLQDIHRGRDHAVNRIRGRGEDLTISYKIKVWLDGQVAAGNYVVIGRSRNVLKYSRSTTELVQWEEDLDLIKSALVKLASSPKMKGVWWSIHEIFGALNGWDGIGGSPSLYYKQPTFEQKSVILSQLEKLVEEGLVEKKRGSSSFRIVQRATDKNVAPL